MGISGPKVPAAPDLNTTIAGQTAANNAAGTNSQRSSMVDQENAYGTLGYTQTGTSSTGAPTYKATQTLSPEQQQIFDYFQSGQTSAGNQGQALIGGQDYSTAPDLSTGENSRVTQRLKQTTDYLNPYLSNAKQELDTNLRNQGFDPNSEGYKRQMRELTQNQDLSMGKITADLQPTAYDQSVQDYTRPAEMSNYLMQMGKPQAQIKDTLTDTPDATYQPTNVIGATNANYDQQMSAYDKKKAQYDAMISGIMSGVGAIAGGPIGAQVGNMISPTVSGWGATVSRA